MKKTTCPICNKKITVDLDGSFWAHGEITEQTAPGKMDWCPMSGGCARPHLLFQVDRSLRLRLYQLEREIWEAQPKGEGYVRHFEYAVSLTNMTTGQVQKLRVTGTATCTASFGFNTYPEIEEVVA